VTTDEANTEKKPLHLFSP